jgi:predicted unusual protein kinase regulating ubiquinone biosynthesis (AarF/ABC1/UbiB family)
LSELRERFSEECDYRIEAGNQEEFRLRWLGRPGVRIPRVYRELSTRRVLVSELIQGEGFESFLGHASPADRDRAGALLFRFAFESVFRQRAFHADPHPGNYLFADGDLILLDFGCVKRLSEPQVEWWKAYFRAYLERDLNAARELVIAMHMVPEPAVYDFDYHHRMALAELQFCLCEDPFRFTPEFLQTVVRAKYLDNPGRFRSNVPRDWVFVNRLLVGVFAVLARLQAEGAFRGVLLDLLYEPGTPRPPAYSSSEALVRQR